MENIPTSQPMAAASLPRKSTFWIVGMIFISGFLASMIAGILVAIIGAKNLQSYNYFAVLIVYLISILGLWYGANYVSKKSVIEKTAVTKISFLVALIFLILYLLTNSKNFSSPSYLLILVITLAVQFFTVWVTLKKKAQ